MFFPESVTRVGVFANPTAVSVRHFSLCMAVKLVTDYDGISPWVSPYPSMIGGMKEDGIIPSLNGTVS